MPEDEPAAWLFEIRRMGRWLRTVTLAHPDDVFADGQDVDIRHVRPLIEAGDRERAGRQARDEPTRSEPADFGGGETTGVQDL
jgi:hypothetical protein